MAIPSLIMLLKNGSYDVPLVTVSAVVKLAHHGECDAVCYLDVANVDAKLSFMRRLRTTFHPSSNCLRLDILMLNRLCFLCLSNWLIMVSLLAYAI
jgi:hypothetical protein